MMNIGMNNTEGLEYVSPSIEIIQIAMEESLCSAQSGGDHKGIYCDSYEDGEEF